jgi:hypothetical protein
MEPVKSSVLTGMTYDAQEKCLYVEFPNGKRYAYYDVPGDAFNALKAAPSKGKFFGQSIKGHFRSEEILKGE